MRQGRKRIVSIMLSLTMVIMTIVGMPMPGAGAEEKEDVSEKAVSGATNATSIFVAGKEGIGECQSTYDYWGQEWIYSDGYTELTDGQSIWQDEGNGYDNNAKAKFTYGANLSTLELDGFKAYGTVGYLKTQAYTEHRYLYGIYYDGNLKIILKNENEILAKYPGSFACVYGIYVTGDLIIVNGGSQGTLDVNMQCDKSGMTVNGCSVGICNEGTLSVSGDGNYPVVKARTGTVTGSLGAYMEAISAGIKCKTYVQDGGRVTGATERVKYNYGVREMDYVISGGKLTGKALAPSSQTARGIYASGSMRVSGGEVIGIGGDDGALADRTYGIYLKGMDNVFSGGTVLGQAGKNYSRRLKVCDPQRSGGRTEGSQKKSQTESL